MGRFSQAEWCCVLALLTACRDPVFYCETAASKDEPRQCHTRADDCQSKDCVTQRQAHCSRAYASHKSIFYCAPSMKECEALRQQRAQEAYAAASDLCKLVDPQQIER
jgi:hypothetical protein